MDIDAAIGENAGVAVDPADGGRGGDYAFQALWCDSSRHKVLLQWRIQRSTKLSTSGYSAAEKRLSRTIGRISVLLCDYGDVSSDEKRVGEKEDSSMADASPTISCAITLAVAGARRIPFR